MKILRSSGCILMMFYEFVTLFGDFSNILPRDRNFSRADCVDPEYF